jgi:hypothetical protein
MAACSAGSRRTSGRAGPQAGGFSGELRGQKGWGAAAVRSPPQEITLLLAGGALKDGPAQVFPQAEQGAAAGAIV